MNVADQIRWAIKEDNPTLDVTSELLLPQAVDASANLCSKAPGVFFGNQIISEMQAIVPNVQFQTFVKDGDLIDTDTRCVALNGDLKTILGIERVLLNFIQRLSGIATTTAQFVNALADPSIQVMDTRKTTPLFRELEKAAVRAGGGVNHRFGLHDMVLVKENHLQRYLTHYGMDAFNSKITDHKLRSPHVLIEVEVASLNVLERLDLAAIDIIMFDNMSLQHLLACLSFLNQQNHAPLKEVSGNITLNTIGRYRGIDIDRISVGSLTHSVVALDVSLLVV
jgi:nicotinate-nucleotide pyrophosphorylase (carboxylating)